MLLVTAFTVALPAEPAEAQPDCDGPPDSRVGCSVTEEIPGDNGGNNNGGNNDGGNNGGGRQPYDVYQTPACPLNGPPPNDPNAMCMGATMACENQGQEGAIMMRIYYQWEPDGPWEPAGSRCTGGDTAEDEVQPPTPDQIRRAVEERLLPRAPLGSSPGNGETIVNFPTIFYTEVDDPWTGSMNLLGWEISITADPVRFIWYPTGRSGESFTATRPGVPYQEGRDSDAYVTYEYKRAGTYEVALDVVWDVSYSVEGGPQNQSLGEATVPGAGTLTVTAHELGSVLTR